MGTERLTARTRPQDPCPKCGALNSIFIVDRDDDEHRCVMCGFGEKGTRTGVPVIPEKRGPQLGVQRDYCRRGHYMSDDNLYIHVTGSRQCLTCKRESNRLWRERNAEEKAAQAV